MSNGKGDQVHQHERASNTPTRENIKHTNTREHQTHQHERTSNTPSTLARPPVSERSLQKPTRFAAKHASSRVWCDGSYGDDVQVLPITLLIWLCAFLIHAGSAESTSRCASCGRGSCSSRGVSCCRSHVGMNNSLEGGRASHPSTDTQQRRGACFLDLPGARSLCAVG